LRSSKNMTKLTLNQQLILNINIMKLYKNSKGNLVTEQQINIMDSYSIETIEDISGKLKIIEHYRGFSGEPFKYFEYFLSPNENKNDIIQYYQNQSLSSGIIIYLNKQTSFDFEMWDWEDYSKTGTLISKGKIIYDNQKREIFYCVIDQQTNEIAYNPKPRKHYYGNSNDPNNLKLDFKYELDSQTNQIKVSIDDDNETSGVIHTMKQDYFIEVFGQNFWDSHPYYHSLLPLLPISSVI